MQSTAANQDYFSDYRPMCPICGQLGYGYHEGHTGTLPHYFMPPAQLNELDPKWRKLARKEKDDRSLHRKTNRR